MTKVLITGANGYTAQFMRQYLQNSGTAEVLCTDMNSNKGLIDYRIDLTEFADVHRIINKERPDIIIHLAGLNRSPSFKDFYRGNVYPVINILESIIQADLPDTRILTISSAAVYGRNSDLISETAPTSPVNWYGSSKVAMEAVCRQYVNSHDLKISIARTFNILGPDQPADFAVASFADQLTRIGRGLAPNTLSTGNLDTFRDFIDIRDVVSAYWTIINSNESCGTFNVATGQAVRIRSVLDRLIEISGLQVNIVQDESRIRKNDILVQDIDNSKLKSLGWSRQFSLDQTLNDLMASFNARYPA